MSETRQILDEIGVERRRQIDDEDWSTEHDDLHDEGELAQAGGCYALSAAGFERACHAYWPWLDSEPNTKGSRRDLVRAAALIVAEIERIDRATGQPKE